MCPICSKIYQSDTSKESIDDEDRISNLPGNVIDCILGKMPLRDAVRTSILSKKWRFYYLAIPQLVFDDQFCKEVNDFVAKKNHGIFSMFELNYQFNEIVTKYLMLHPRRIETFQVCFPRYLTSTMVPDGGSAVIDVNKWILYLSGRNINKLTLIYAGVLNYRHKLPSYFFSCLDLTFLKLQNFVILPPPKFKGFLNLYQLKLIRVDFANNCFESFLSGCPVLERLSLRRCSGVRHFNISGSKLKRLHIKAFDNFESISLENAPNLTEVTVTLERLVIGLEGGKLISDLVKLVGSLPKLKILCLKWKVSAAPI
ncbi:F-box/FBD/LRR-repeat protein At1g13570-like [Nicotiana tabacum]|uniref:F-box/FBD/LRR-repeat protein At1g13570-like n=2 Tax=Nicotiana tabacum TaxID=4097 RepID=A0AC58TI12_TOBAC|nr:PREDICTED: F-box/FBD/LRR-repeat protein At1g13570-like [Nicotiana tabacum]